MKKVAVFDIDGTLFRWQLYHELVFELKSLGHFSTDETQGLDDAFVLWQGRRISWHDYEAKVIHAIEANIVRIAPEALESAARSVVERSGHKIYNYTAKLLHSLQADGYFTIAISASQQEIAEQFAARYGFDECIAALWERQDGRYTGRKAREIFGRKDAIVREYIAEHPELTLEDCVAVGDSDGDISLLQLASTAIAFNPSAELLDQAVEHGWQVVIERKNIAYTLGPHDGSYILETTDRF